MAKRKLQNLSEENNIINVYPIPLINLQNLIFTELKNVTTVEREFVKDEHLENLKAKVDQLSMRKKHSCLETQAEKYSKILKGHFPESEKSEEDFIKVVEDSLSEIELDQLPSSRSSRKNNGSLLPSNSFSQLKSIVSRRLRGDRHGHGCMYKSEETEEESEEVLFKVGKDNIVPESIEEESEEESSLQINTIERGGNFKQSSKYIQENSQIIMKKKSPSKAESYRRMLELSTAETEQNYRSNKDQGTKRTPKKQDPKKQERVASSGKKPKSTRQNSSAKKRTSTSKNRFVTTYSKPRLPPRTTRAGTLHQNKSSAKLSSLNTSKASYFQSKSKNSSFSKNRTPTNNDIKSRYNQDWGTPIDREGTQQYTTLFENEKQRSKRNSNRSTSRNGSKKRMTPKSSRNNSFATDDLNNSDFSTAKLLKQIVRDAKGGAKRGSTNDTISELGINKNSSITSSKFLEDGQPIAPVVEYVQVDKICLNEDSSTQDQDGSKKTISL